MCGYKLRTMTSKMSSHGALRTCSIKALIALAVINTVSALVWLASQHQTQYWNPSNSHAVEVVVQKGEASSHQDAVFSNDTTAVRKELERLQKLMITMQARKENQTRPDEENKKPQKCLKTVASLTKYSKWFRERYRPGMKLFLDKEDTHHYANMSSRILPFGLKSQKLDVMSKLLLHENFMNPSVHKYSGRKSGCIRCAVVGCGGILNGSGAGAEIDSHDYIFRVNRPFTTGKFAADVGTRTAFYTFFPESQHIKNIEDKEAILFFAMFKQSDVDYGLRMLNSPKLTGTEQKKALPADPKMLKFVHPDFFYYVFHNFLDNKSARPTTGALIVFLALHICDEVNLYGFGYDPHFTMHYYDTKFVVHTEKLTRPHDVDHERKLWMKLHDEGVVRLFKRDV